MKEMIRHPPQPRRGCSSAVQLARLCWLYAASVFGNMRRSVDLVDNDIMQLDVYNASGIIYYLRT